MKICEVKTLKELSNKYGYKDNWATTTRKREGIPFDICVKISEEKNVTMDYLLFGIRNNSVDMGEIKAAVTEGVFSAIQSEMIELNKNVKISQVIEIITSEIKDTYKIKDESQKLMGNR